MNVCGYGCFIAMAIVQLAWSCWQAPGQEGFDVLTWKQKNKILCSCCVNVNRHSSCFFQFYTNLDVELCFIELLAGISPCSPGYQWENKFRFQVNIGASYLWKFQKVILELSFPSFGFKTEMSQIVELSIIYKTLLGDFLVIEMCRFIPFLRIELKVFQSD